MRKFPRPRLVILLVFLLGLPLFVLVILSAHKGVRLLSRTEPLQDASMHVKYELAQFHFNLEKNIFMDRSSDPHEMWKHLDKAEWYANAMLRGGKDSEWTYVPLEDRAFRMQTLEILTKIDTLRSLAKERLRMAGNRKKSEELENKFEPVILGATIQADRVESALLDTVVKEKNGYLAGIYGLLALCVLFGAGFTAALYKNLKEAKRSEEEISSMRGFLQSIIDGVTDLIVVIDLDHNVVLINQAAESYFGMQKPLKCHKLSHGLDHPCDEDWPCPLEVVVASGKPIVLEHAHQTDGKLRYMEISASPLRNSDGRITGVIESIRDITDRKELERQRTDFYAMVTHDLKSPLTSMLGYTELMLSGKAGSFDENIREMLESVSRSGMKLFRIVDDFLTLSKVDSRQKMEPAPWDVAGPLRETASEFELMALRNGLEFNADIPDGLPAVVLDKRSVQRAVANLLENAVNYTPAGGAVTLKTEQRNGHGSFVEISVSDTGPGIPAEEQARIFDKYYRSPKTSGIRGSGLGLAIVKAVAEAHGGRIELESEEGKGSVFRLVFPAGRV